MSYRFMFCSRRETSDRVGRIVSELRHCIPSDANTPYDMRYIIQQIVDTDDEFFEIMPDFAKNIVIGFARLNGHSIGVVANQV